MSEPVHCWYIARIFLVCMLSFTSWRSSDRTEWPKRISRCCHYPKHIVIAKLTCVNVVSRQGYYRLVYVIKFSMPLYFWMPFHSCTYVTSARFCQLYKSTGIFRYYSWKICPNDICLTGRLLSLSQRGRETLKYVRFGLFLWLMTVCLVIYICSTLEPVL